VRTLHNYVIQYQYAYQRNGEIMLTLEDFDKKIRELPEHHEARPFLCEGSPIGCKIFLIGLNPSTPISFWPYWSVEYGCKKKEWLNQTLLHYY